MKKMVISGRCCALYEYGSGGPVILWGAVLWGLAACFPHWFWVIYGVQLLNVSGAAGDVYVTWRLMGMPASVLVRDTGTAMLVYGNS